MKFTDAMNVMDFKKLHRQKLFEIVMALQGAGLPTDNHHVRRLAFLMNYHLTKHQIRLAANQAVELLKLEIVEALVHEKGRGFFYTTVPASLN